MMCDDGGVLSGRTFAVKDTIDAFGFPTTAGTPGLAAHLPAVSAPVVARLEGAGARLVGKTAMDELSVGVSGSNAHTGPVRNPIDPARSAGGSSGGSAVAVARGEVDFALGTDTGGSVRLPAAHCGVFGFRPSTGRYPTAGILGLSPALDTPGIFGADPGMIARVDAVLAGGSGDESPGPAAQQPGRSALRVGIPDFAWRDLAPHVARAARERLQALPWTPVPIAEEDLFTRASSIFHTLVRGDALAAINRYLLGSAISLEDLLSQVVSPGVATFLGGIRSAPVEPAEYDGARAGQRRMRKDYAAMFARAGVDLIAFPTAPLTAPPLADEFITAHNGREEPVFPISVRNLLVGAIVGAPSLSLPAPVATGELPVGLCVEAPPGRDRLLLAAIASAGEAY